MDRTGQTLLGKYELTRLVGKGGMGEVWEGEHQLTGRRVAVKVLSDNYLTNRKVVARFGREARAASSVHHDGIVEILDQDKTQDGVPFLVMEFLEGESVGARIKKRKRLSQSEALAIMLPLLDALDAAHRAGVVHRDLKPDNVFILPGTRGAEPVKILDFGISQKADEIEHHLTQEGAVLGTPHYMSPEQARGESGVDARADVYSAGVLLYECVVGDVPFDAGNYNALLQIILTKPPESPRKRGAQISCAMEQALLAVLHKDKNKRPGSARALHDLLVDANAQPDDAKLDCERWTFQSAASKPDVEGSQASKPFSLEGPTSGVRRAPETEGASPRESGEFDFPAPPARAHSPLPPVEARAPSPRPQPPAPPPTRAPVLRVPAPPQVPLEHALPLPLPMPPAPAPRVLSGPAPSLARAPLPDLALRDPLPVARTPVVARAPEPAEKPRALEARLEKPRNDDAEEAEAEEGPSRLAKFGRALAGWLLVLAAIGALVYVASLVFNRPDPRKVRRAPEAPGAEP